MYSHFDVIMSTAYLFDAKIVPEISACLRPYPRHEVPTDHFEMCKFDGKYDKTYQKVSNLLQEWVLDLKDQLKGVRDFAIENLDHSY